MKKTPLRRAAMRRAIRPHLATRKGIKHRAWSHHTTELRTLRKYQDEFRGQNVVIVGREIVGAKSGAQALRLLREMEKRHPRKVPLIAYVPEKDKVYIL